MMIDGHEKIGLDSIQVEEPHVELKGPIDKIPNAT